MELPGKYQAPGKTQRKVVLQRKVGVWCSPGAWVLVIPPCRRIHNPDMLPHLLPGSSCEPVVVEEMVLVSIYLCVFLPEKKYHVWEFLISSLYSSHHLHCIMNLSSFFFIWVSFLYLHALHLPKLDCRLFRGTSGLSPFDLFFFSLASLCSAVKRCGSIACKYALSAIINSCLSLIIPKTSDEHH